MGKTACAQGEFGLVAVVQECAAKSLVLYLQTDIPIKTLGLDCRQIKLNLFSICAAVGSVSNYRAFTVSSAMTNAQPEVWLLSTGCETRLFSRAARGRRGLERGNTRITTGTYCTDRILTCLRGPVGCTGSLGRLNLRRTGCLYATDRSTFTGLHTVSCRIATLCLAGKDQFLQNPARQSFSLSSATAIMSPRRFTKAKTQHKERTHCNEHCLFSHIHHILTSIFSIGILQGTIKVITTDISYQDTSFGYGAVEALTSCTED